MSTSPEHRNRLISILVVLAFPALLIIYLFVSRYGWDLSLLINDVRASAESAMRAFTSIFGPISDAAFAVLRWASWIVAPVLTGLLVRRVKLSLTPLETGVAGLAGVITTLCLMFLTRDMPREAVLLMLLSCVIALVAGAMSRSFTRFPIAGVIGIAAILGLNVLALSM